MSTQDMVTNPNQSITGNNDTLALDDYNYKVTISGAHDTLNIGNGNNVVDLTDTSVNTIVNLGNGNNTVNYWRYYT